jgi:hypothetical protein
MGGYAVFPAKKRLTKKGAFMPLKKGFLHYGNELLPFKIFMLLSHPFLPFTVTNKDAAL